MDELIEAYIEPHPAKPGRDKYRLKEDEGGYPVWAIIGDLAPGILSEEDVIREFRIRARRWMPYWRSTRAIKKESMRG